MSKRQQIREKRMKQQRQQRLIIISMVIVGALLVATALIYPSLKPVGDVVSITPRTFNTTVSRNTLGDPNAPVRMDVWEDFQCPACASYTANIEPLVISNYVDTGKVFYTFHNYAFIDSQVATKESQQAASASLCAADQDRFWDYHDMLYTNWNGENQGAFNDKRLVAFAEDLGLDMGTFNTCFNSGRYIDSIKQELADGQALGITGTPSVFVNGVEVTPGYVPSFDQVSAAIDAALAGK